MQVSFLNIGTSVRSIPNLKGVHVNIPVGTITVIDIQPNLADRIKSREDHDTLIIIGNDVASIPVKMTVVLDLLKDFDAIPYDRLLGQVNEIMGADRGTIIARPPRELMRGMLVAAARHYAAEKFGVSANYSKAKAEALVKKPLAYTTSKAKAVADEKDVTVNDPYAALDAETQGGSVEDDDEYERIEKEEAAQAKAEQDRQAKAQAEKKAPHAADPDQAGDAKAKAEKPARSARKAGKRPAKAKKAAGTPKSLPRKRP